jgi:hypothetical protein
MKQVVAVIYCEEGVFQVYLGFPLSTSVIDISDEACDAEVGMATSR